MVTPVFAVAGLSSVLGQSAQEPRNAWAPVVLLLLIGIGFAVGNLVISLIIGPSRTGPGKEATYESGMLPVGDTHKRFNVRFYIVAMIFLVFDVEIVFMYPWATIFASKANTAIGGLLLAEMIVFVAIILRVWWFHSMSAPS